MIYVDQDPILFAEKYGIKIEDFNCKSCDKVFPINIPFRIKGYAGLTSKIHECGDSCKGAVFVPITEEKISFWRDIIG